MTVLVRLISMTVGASLLIIAAAAARGLFRNKIPAKIFRLIWLAAAVRMLLPFNAEVKIGEPEVRTVYTSAPVSESTSEHIKTAADITSPDDTTDMPTRQDISPVLFAVWLCGAASAAGYFLYGHLRFRKEYACAVLAEMNIAPAAEKYGVKRKVTVKICESISSPVTYGTLRPVILLPKGTAPDDSCTGLAVAHELVHIRRFDAAYKQMIAAAVVIHWFNPLSWLMYSLAVRDMEISCDMEVINGGKISPADYARALIAMEERRISPLAEGFGTKPIKERIEAVMKFRSKPMIAAIAASAAAIAAAAVFVEFKKPDPEIIYIMTDSTADTAGDITEPVGESELDETEKAAQEVILRQEEEQRRAAEQYYSENELLEEKLQEEIRQKQEQMMRLREEQLRISAELAELQAFSLSYPVAEITNISEPFGSGEDGKDFHKGVDFSCEGCEGMDISAAADGTVICAEDSGNGYGQCVMIDHGNGYSTLYAHCGSISVSEGDEVSQGEKIGTIGSTGYAYGPHLHFEVRENGQYADPVQFLTGASADSMVNTVSMNS